MKKSFNTFYRHLLVVGAGLIIAASGLIIASYSPVSLPTRFFQPSPLRLVAAFLTLGGLTLIIMEIIAFLDHGPHHS